MGKISSCFEKIQESNFTRIAMVIQLPGIDIPFIYDSPPFYLAQYQSSTNKKKLLEGRFMNLDSFLQSGCFKRIVIRKLCKKKKEISKQNLQVEEKEGEEITVIEKEENKLVSNEKQEPKTPVPESENNSESTTTNVPLINLDYDDIKVKTIENEPHEEEQKDGFLTARAAVPLSKKQTTLFSAYCFHQNNNSHSFKEIRGKNVTHLYAYICLTKDKHDFQWEKIKKFFELVKESKIEIGSTFINVSSLFSSEILALSYAALGFIHEDDPTRKYFFIFFILKFILQGYSYYTIQKFLELEELEKGMNKQKERKFFLIFFFFRIFFRTSS